jgi:hypothetical protein
MYLNIIKAIYHNPIATSYLMGKNWNHSPKVRNKTRMPMFPTPIQHNPAILSQSKKVKCGKPSGSPKPLGKEQSYCSFCSTALREIATVQEDSCWTLLFFLCMELGRPSSKDMMFRTWARSRSHVTANLSKRSRETWGLPG